MGIIDSIKSGISKYYSPPSLGNSAAVTRNYGKTPVFDPVRQVTGITYKAIDKIGQSLSMYEPIVQRPNGGTYENHPLLTLFNKPNPAMNASDFVHLFAMLYEIYGETFWYKVTGENTGRVRELYLLNPAQMELVIQQGELVGYVLHKNNGEQVPFLPNEIIHDKRPNPFNEWRGLSVLEKAAVYVDTEITTSHFTLNYIKNNASPSGIVSLPDMAQETFKQFTQQWREGYEGPQNAGKTAFIRGGEASFKAVGATLKDIELEKVRNMTKDDVLMMLDVPKPLLGLTDESGFGRGNVETLKYIFAESKIEPMMRRLDRIYEAIGVDLNKGQPINVTHTSPIPEDKEFQLKTHEKGVNIWLTINEVRTAQGLLPIKGGDELQPQNVVQQPTKSIKVAMKQQPKQPEPPSKAEIAKKLSEEQEEFRSNLIKTNDIYAGKLKSTMSTFADEQESAVIDKINATSKAFEEWLFEVKEQSEKLASAMIPVIIDLMEAQSEDVANFITGELLTISPEVRSAVDQNIKQIAGIYNTDTLKALEQTLSEGQLSGESLAKLKKRVEEVYSDAKGYRAERIARTESLKASNSTAELVYKQNGFSEVEWFINPGACQFCRTYAGRRKTIGQNFNNIGDVITGDEGGQLRIEYDNIPTPPLHPNCTCSLIPV